MANYKSLEELMQGSRNEIFAAAYRLAQNHDEARELVQATFYRVVRSWRRYDKSRSIKAWFFAVMRNAFLDNRRRHAYKYCVSLDAPLDKHEATTIADQISGVDKDMLECLVRQEVSETVQTALSGLSFSQKAVLVMCDCEGLKPRDVARVLRLPIGTIRSRLFRARKYLRKAPILAAMSN